MKVFDYNQFVEKTDQSKGRPLHQRAEIARYGLAGEIGSLLSAVKKKLLAEGGELAWDQPSEEIKEELGDVLWYCFALGHAENSEPFDILASDIELLKREIGASNARAEKIKAALEPNSRDAFLEAAKAFPPSPDYTLSDYQRLAFRTARTDGRVLLEVCLAVLTQLAAELLRSTLPAVELSLNKNVADRPCNTVLGEITWHLAAVASIYKIQLDEVADYNIGKVGFRADRGSPTPLHDVAEPPSGQFPRRFEIAFVRVSPKRSRMYFEGRRLGDDISDNAADDDGYRFHDVMHLALVAHLGWSPVIRGMMGRKRPKIDEVQDSGRAKVVEELVIKAIHSEGERQAKDPGRCQIDGPTRLFQERSTIPFSLIKTLRYWVQDLEARDNKHWEWENAIFTGCELFHLLRTHKQGTVIVDLENRIATFAPSLCPSVTGLTVGFGMASASSDQAENLLTSDELARARAIGFVKETVAAKKATLQALGLVTDFWNQAEVDLLPGNRISVRAVGQPVQERIWSIGAVDFKVAFAETTDDHALCSVLAMADADIKRK